ncbi:MAG: heme biosynthesis HemY N-terminal domain-containing protein [Pseudohongiellaceae bacterium]
MIRFFVYSLLALIAGAVLSVLLEDDPGYVLVSFAGYSMETSVVVIVFAVLALFILVYGIITLLKYIFSLLKHGGIKVFNNRQRARLATEKGLLLLCEGRFPEAYRLLVQNAGNVESPLLNYMAASLAAFQEGDRKSWMFCLQKAEKYSGNSIPVDSLKAFYEMKSGNAEQSLAMLLELRKQQPNNRYFLRMIKNLYLSLEDWEQIALLLPELEKYTVMTARNLEGLYVKAGIARLEQIDPKRDAATLYQCWESIPKKYRNNEKLLATYLGKLIEVEDAESVQKQVNNYIKNTWSDELVMLVGRLDCNDPGQQILWLEKWFKERPANAALALTLGRLSLRNQQWVKGREYLEMALSLSHGGRLAAEINAELARLLDHLGEHERSVACYREAVGILDKKLPDLPMPL